jgi:diadenosine tetraphosphate (Ap4A) HIT family hydrolase/protein-tyrosine-phosphatase
MPGTKSILFVCTGNIFRSVSAEQGFKKYLADTGMSGWSVGSAGIEAAPMSIDPQTLETLRELGIEQVEHQQRRLTKEILDAYDVVVGMAENHIAFMESAFGYKYALLFNELAAAGKTSVLDIENEVPDYETNRPAVEQMINRTVRTIVDKVPTVFKNISERFYLFEDFARGATTHRNGYPFITLHETPHSIAFMSIDIPSNEDGHVLVIPKKRYASLSDIPDDTLNEILTSVKKVGEALSIDHGGYNILLNNGLDAGQYIIHTHFHIIPRRSGDGITMEGWEKPVVNREEFIRLNEKLRQQIAQLP